MMDVETMIKALSLAWIPRLCALGRKNLKTVPDYYLGGYGGLSFLLRCTYDPKYIDGLPSFYKDILKFFNELKTLHNCDRGQDMILFNNKEILVRGKPIFIREWLNNNIMFIQDLSNSNGQFMSYQEFKNKYACKIKFLRFYRVVSVIPKHQATNAKNTVTPESEPFIENSPLFQLDELTEIHLLGKAKTKDFHQLQYLTKRLTQGVKLVQQNGIKPCSWMEKHEKKNIYLPEKYL